MPLKGAIVNDVKGMPRVPVRIDFDRPDIQGFNTEDLLKPGLSVEPKVRVRWLPRTRPPNSALVGTESIPKVALQHRRQQPPTSVNATTTSNALAGLRTRELVTIGRYSSPI
jgi:hypothetical protein